MSERGLKISIPVLRETYERRRQANIVDAFASRRSRTRSTHRGPTLDKSAIEQAENRRLQYSN